MGRDYREKRETPGVEPREFAPTTAMPATSLKLRKYPSFVKKPFQRVSHIPRSFAAACSPKFRGQVVAQRGSGRSVAVLGALLEIGKRGCKFLDNFRTPIGDIVHFPA